MIDLLTEEQARKEEEMEFHDKRERDRKALSDEEFQKKYSNKKWYSITEQSRLFVEKWLKNHCKDAVSLDFGCGLGGNSLRMVQHGANVFAIDISPESVKTTSELLKAKGLEDKLTAQVMDGENLTFEDNKFDVIVCSGVLHHVDVNAVFPELARVLKPTGVVIAMEALGYNPIIRLYRQLTPALRTAWETDHILKNKELKIAKKYFDGLEVNYFYLFSILAVPFRNSVVFKPLLAVLRAVDYILLKIPGVQLMAWQMIFFLSKPK